MTTEFKIEHLADHAEHVPLLAGWFHAQWGYLSPNYTLEERTERLYTKAQRDGIPITFIAISDGRPVGSASLVECDMHTRSHLTPWMSSVYVEQSARKQGIGEALVSRAVQHAKALSFDSTYLWTPDKDKYYQRLGWHELERTTYKNKRVVVMSKDNDIA